MLPKMACPSLPERSLPWTNPALLGPNDLSAFTALTAEFLATTPQTLDIPTHFPHQQVVSELPESALWQLWRWKALGDTSGTQRGTHHVLSQMGTLSHHQPCSYIIIIIGISTIVTNRPTLCPNSSEHFYKKQGYSLTK